MADHIASNGVIPESALDHVYFSEKIENNVKCKSIPISSTDHLPVVTNYKMKINIC